MIYRFYALSASSDPTNYRYVGVTTKTVQDRFSGHKYCAMHADKRALPVHKWMYSHYEKGESILVTEIHQCDETIWEKEEIRLISEYREKGFNLLNLQKGGKGVITKEMRNLDGIQRSAKAHEKPIYAINKETMEIAYEFESITKATEFLNYNSRSAIGNVLSGVSKSCGGYYWVWKADWDNNINNIDNSVNKHGNQKCVYKFDKNGTLIATFNSLKDATRDIGVKSMSALQKNIKDKTMYKDYFWSMSNQIDIEEYLNNTFPVIEYMSDGTIVDRYKLQSEVAQKYNYSQTYVCTSIKQKTPLKNGNFIKVNKN